MSKARYQLPLHLLEAPDHRELPAKTIDRGNVTIRARHAGELIAKASSYVEDLGYRIRSVNVGPNEVIVYVHAGGPKAKTIEKAISLKAMKG